MITFIKSFSTLGIMTFCMALFGGNIYVAQAVTLNVDAKSNIYGAGQNMPPSQIGGAGILPPVYNFSAASRQILTFSTVTGSITYRLGAFPFNGPDGIIRSNSLEIPSLNGISGIIDDRGRYLVGVFLDNSTPQNPAPVNLNFVGNHDFQELSPLIGQTFFIGDGLTGTGSGNIQKFNVPATATRLFLGFMDGNGRAVLIGAYNDNSGSLTVNFEIQSSNSQSIPEPSTILGILALGVATAIKQKKTLNV